MNHKKISCVGVDLSGAQSGRTAVVGLDYYPKLQKVFLKSWKKKFKEESPVLADESLLKYLQGLKPDHLGFSAPLKLPPCLPCKIRNCPSVAKCRDPQVKWMREFAKADRKKDFFTPYLHRPADLFLRKQLVDVGVSPLDGALGANRAPLTARLHFLQKQWKGTSNIVETCPRVTVPALNSYFSFADRDLRLYRSMEKGIFHRAELLNQIGETRGSVEVPDIFIYSADAAILAEDLGLFDAFFSAIAVLFHSLGHTESLPYPKTWGKLAIPNLPLKTS